MRWVAFATAADARAWRDAADAALGYPRAQDRIIGQGRAHERIAAHRARYLPDPEEASDAKHCVYVPAKHIQDVRDVTVGGKKADTAGARQAFEPKPAVRR